MDEARRMSKEIGRRKTGQTLGDCGLEFVIDAKSLLWNVGDLDPGTGGNPLGDSGIWRAVPGRPEVRVRVVVFSKGKSGKQGEICTTGHNESSRSKS